MCSWAGAQSRPKYYWLLRNYTNKKLCSQKDESRLAGCFTRSFAICRHRLCCRRSTVSSSRAERTICRLLGNFDKFCLLPVATTAVRFEHTHVATVNLQYTAVSNNYCCWWCLRFRGKTGFNFDRWRPRAQSGYVFTFFPPRTDDAIPFKSVWLFSNCSARFGRGGSIASYDTCIPWIIVISTVFADDGQRRRNAGSAVVCVGDSQSGQAECRRLVRHLRGPASYWRKNVSLKRIHSSPRHYQRHDQRGAFPGESGHSPGTSKAILLQQNGFPSGRITFCIWRSPNHRWRHTKIVGHVERRCYWNISRENWRSDVKSLFNLNNKLQDFFPEVLVYSIISDILRC